MLSRKSLAAITVTTALACVGASFGADTLTDGPFMDSHAATTDWVQDLVVPQFDEMGGARILVKATIEWSAGVAGMAQVESEDLVPRVTTATLAADILMTGPSGFSVNPMPSDNRVFMASAYDGTTDFAGTSGAMFDDIAAGETGMEMFTNPLDLTAFIGSGDVTFPVDANAMSTVTGPGNVSQILNTDASASVTVTYEYIDIPQVCNFPADVEPNDVCDAENIEESCSIVDIAECGNYIDGKLEKRIAQGCEPDTYLVLFDKLNNIVDRDDNGSNKGNGWASGLFGINEDNGIIDNGDGTRGIRIGVTGRADGLDNVFNGLFQNGPHGQAGKFTVSVTFLDGDGEPLVSPILPQGGGISENPVTYTDEFISGAEAFYINYVLPQGTVSVDVCIDNVIACEIIREDVDFFCLENLVPLCDYCIVQVGGLDMECTPTATALGWFDKSCELILKAVGNLPTPGYTELCVVADANGRVIFAVSGYTDCNFNGINDEHELVEVAEDRAPPECQFIDWGHGVAGCYTLLVKASGPHAGEASPPDNGGADDTVAAMLEALSRGDTNQDGVTDTADLGMLIGNFGWVAP